LQGLCSVAFNMQRTEAVGVQISLAHTAVQKHLRQHYWHSGVQTCRA